MLRLLARLTLTLLANALGLLVAAALLDNFSMSAPSFIVAVLIFTAVMVVLGPLVVKLTLKYANFLMGGIALVTTFVSLGITNLLTDGISISGFNTWVLATLVVWIFSIVGNLLLPLVIFKKTLQKAKQTEPATSLR